MKAWLVTFVLVAALFCWFFVQDEQKRIAENEEIGRQNHEWFIMSQVQWFEERGIDPAFAIPEVVAEAESLGLR